MNHRHLTEKPTQHLFKRKKPQVHSLWAKNAVSQNFGTGSGNQCEMCGPMGMSQDRTVLRTIVLMGCLAVMPLLSSDSGC